MTNQKEHEDEVVIIHDRAGVEVDVNIRHENGSEIIEVDIESCGRGNRPPHPGAHRYRIKIDHQYYVVEKRLITGRELLLLAHKNPPEKWEIEKRMHGGDYVALELDQHTDLGEPGIEVFETFPLDETEG